MSNENGAGRPAQDGAQGMTRYNVMLDAETLEILESVHAHRSVAIRQLARWYSESKFSKGETK